MKAALLQTDIRWCDKAYNIARADEMIRRAERADIYVLPEMWSTGFVIEAQQAAEPESSCEALAWMCRTARERDCAIVGSIAVCEAGQFYNRLYFVTGDGTVARYDKRHLFRIGGETKRFTAGGGRVVVEWRGMRFLLMVCYDLRFPVWARNAVAEEGECADYDVAICVASWPQERLSCWDTLIRARAIENQAYMVAVNRVGEDAWCRYTGGSAVIDATGQTIASAGLAEGVAYAELDKKSLEECRRKFPTLRDADRFEIITE